MTQANAREFRTTLKHRGKDGAFLPLPFDPVTAWGERARHHVHGRVNGIMVRGPLSREGDDFGLPLGPAWLRNNPVKTGDEVDVVLWPEGPQLDDLPEDIAAALADEPEAQEFFQSLAQFYRKAYLTWLKGASKRRELRKQRLSEFIDLLKAGKKQR